MAKATRIEVFQMMERQGMIPLFYNSDIEIAQRIITACYRGGSRVMEFTTRGDFGHEIFREISHYCNEVYPEMILGVGSLTSAGEASLYIQMGANFVVTPSLRKDIAIICNRKKILWSPGCSTLTEICRAEELGCELIKLFPANTLGPSFLKAIKGPQPWTNLIPTNGITTSRENLESWFSAGAVCVGMGSKIVKPRMTIGDDFEALEIRVRDTLELISDIRID